MLSKSFAVYLLSCICMFSAMSHAFVLKPTLQHLADSTSSRPIHGQQGRRRTFVAMSDGSDGAGGGARPSTFREAEVLGLKLMQEGQYEDALKVFKDGLRLPGSRSDVVRTKSLSGPSPVGGAFGGLESQNVQTLDEFELQAAHYNMACAMSQLGLMDEALAALETALQNGFDNYATVRSDPDLEPLQGLADFDKLMQKYEPDRGFNPFGLFQKNKK